MIAPSGVLGEGAFSTVVPRVAESSARGGGQTRTRVADKRIRLVGGGTSIPCGIFREIMALRHLQPHENVVKLHDVAAEEFGVVLSLEYAPIDVAQLIECQRPYLPLDVIKTMLRMLFSGIVHMHSMRIMHRDLKPSNLLVSYNGVLKIADFGLCRIFHPDDNQRTYSHQVCTRYYRPPEILFGAKRYGPSIDVWSAGAIAAELFEGIPLLPGMNDIDQISKTFAALDTPPRGRDSLISPTLEKSNLRDAIRRQSRRSSRVSQATPIPMPLPSLSASCASIPQNDRALPTR